ncbi:hypothetical protein Pelo_18116 [Pelomyxa schiedti]|nr:hypothetical protein Pelo_18116 [Pelomyxa schiedti]
MISAQRSWAHKYSNNNVAGEANNESDVTTAVAHCVSLDNFRGAVLLLNNFHLHDSPDVRTMWEAVLRSLPRADISSAQQLAVGRFTPPQVAESLTTRFVTVHSSKTAKWLIGKYNLTAQQLKANNNSLLFQLIRGSKTSCADWFIRNFAVTLPEVLLMFEKQSSSHIDFPSRETQITEMRLSTWKMLLQRFPGITAETVRQHCMRAVSASPSHIEYSIRTLGLTAKEIALYCQAHFPCTLPTDTRLWLARQGLF